MTSQTKRPAEKLSTNRISFSHDPEKLSTNRISFSRNRSKTAPGRKAEPWTLNRTIEARRPERSWRVSRQTVAGASRSESGLHPPVGRIRPGPPTCRQRRGKPVSCPPKPTASRRTVKSKRRTPSRKWLARLAPDRCRSVSLRVHSPGPLCCLRVPAVKKSPAPHPKSKIQNPSSQLPRHFLLAI